MTVKANIQWRRHTRACLPWQKYLRPDSQRWSGLFCDGTRRYGVPAAFFQVKKKQFFL